MGLIFTRLPFTLFPLHQVRFPSLLFPLLSFLSFNFPFAIHFTLLLFFFPSSSFPYIIVASLPSFSFVSFHLPCHSYLVFPHFFLPTLFFPRRCLLAASHYIKLHKATLHFLTTPLSITSAAFRFVIRDVRRIWGVKDKVAYYPLVSAKS